MEGFNPDGTPIGGGNFTNQGQGTTGTTGQTALGTSFDPRTGMADFQDGATEGDIRDPYAYGGVSGTVRRDPSGNLYVDREADGRSRDVNRLRGVADDAAKREAFHMDYTKGDADRAQSDATRGNQGVATAMLGNAAKGGAPSGAVIRGQGATDSSLSAALGAQAGARGGATNQAAATMAGEHAAAGNQLGVAQHLGAARSGELTSARGAYSQGTNAMRTGDYQQQALDQQRQKVGLANEMGQRELNQNRELGYEGLGYDVNVNAMNAALKNQDRHAGLTGASLARETAQADRMASFYNKGIGAAGDLGGKLLRDDDK